MFLLLVVLHFLAVVNTQYVVQPQFKPDLTFNENNDRYDLTSFIRYHDQLLRQSSIGRRSNTDNLKRKGRWIILNAKGQRDVLESIKKTIQNELDEIGRIADDWRRSDRGIYPVDVEPEDNANFEMSVDELAAKRSLDDVLIKVSDGARRAQGPTSNRRKETQLDYAVPIEMKINGYLALPEDV